jgi:hypothetical protein
MFEDFSDILLTFSLNIKLHTLAYLIAWKLQTKLLIYMSEILHTSFRQKSSDRISDMLEIKPFLYALSRAPK